MDRVEVLVPRALLAHTHGIVSKLNHTIETSQTDCKGECQLLEEAEVGVQNEI